MISKDGKNLIPLADAAAQFGIRPDTLYRWLRQSDRGKFMLRGQVVTIFYFQGGRLGQGRIMFEQHEIDRLKELMRAHPKAVLPAPTKHLPFKHITVIPGRPD